MRRQAFWLTFAFCIAISLCPIWASRYLPAVDAPQHMFLIHVLGNLSDQRLPFHQIYSARPGLTYLTFYYATRAIAFFTGEEIALKIWLSLVLGAIPLSVLALLQTFGKSRWLALLACLLVFTDNFYWGLVSFQSSLPLTLLAIAFFVRALEHPRLPRPMDSEHKTAGSAVLSPDAPAKLTNLAALSIVMVLLQLTHAAAMIFPAVALPLMLATTPSNLKRRLAAALALCPGVALFAAWLLMGVQHGRNLGAPGEPWKASASLFHRSNFQFDPVFARAERFVELLANGFWSYADRPVAYVFLLTVALCPLTYIAARRSGASEDSLKTRAETGSAYRHRWTWHQWIPGIPRSRPALLFALALIFYFFLPTDISGYMYYIHPRYAQLAALLAIPVLGISAGPLKKPFIAFAVGCVVYCGVHLTILFQRFGNEAKSFEPLLTKIEPGSRILHLITDWGSRYATHAVYLHYAALAAMRTNSVPSFSLAIDPSFPVGYKQGAKPPASPWEWRPNEVTREQSLWYDHFLCRGKTPIEAILGSDAAQVELVSRSDSWMLYRKRPAR